MNSKVKNFVGLAAVSLVLFQSFKPEMDYRIVFTNDDGDTTDIYQTQGAVLVEKYDDNLEEIVSYPVDGETVSFNGRYSYDFVTEGGTSITMSGSNVTITECDDCPAPKVPDQLRFE